LDKHRNKKRHVGRPKTGPRPVIAMRMHPNLYAEVLASAAARRLSIAEEAARRIQQSFDWDRTHGEANKLIADAQEVIAGGKEVALRRCGIHPVIGRPGLWVEIDKISLEEIVALNPMLENLVETLVARILEKKSTRS
jgi:hypothetical protein